MASKELVLAAPVMADLPRVTLMWWVRFWYMATMGAASFDATIASSRSYASVVDEIEGYFPEEREELPDVWGWR